MSLKNRMQRLGYVGTRRTQRRNRLFPMGKNLLEECITVVGRTPSQ